MTAFENMSPLEQAHAHEYAAMLVRQHSERQMRLAITWAARDAKQIDALLAEAKRLRGVHAAEMLEATIPSSHTEVAR